MDDYETTGATPQKLNASSGQNLAAKFGREARWQTLTESGLTLGFSAVPTCPLFINNVFTVYTHVSVHAAPFVCCVTSIVFADQHTCKRSERWQHRCHAASRRGLLPIDMRRGVLEKGRAAAAGIQTAFI